MSTGQTILLGAIAGFTIYLGLPVGRMRTNNMRVKTWLSGISAGILVFLLVEILHDSFEVVEDAITDAHAGKGWGAFTGLTLAFTVGVGVGLLSLFYIMRAFRPAPKQSVGPGAMAVAEMDAAHIRKRDAMHLAISIAAAIGLHNFSEGLAIGQSAHTGDTKLALLLVIGFALHNTTEGFGIVGPLAGADVRASWKWIGLFGLIGGAPTFAGTIIGTSFTSSYLSVGFLALAGGAILYVVGELFAGGRKMDWEMMLWGAFAGFLAGAATELILTFARA
ncbi:MAG: ZIP family metal transporter [Actinomycetota bacterium]